MQLSEDITRLEEFAAKLVPEGCSLFDVNLCVNARMARTAGDVRNAFHQFEFSLAPVSLELATLGSADLQEVFFSTQTTADAAESCSAHMAKLSTQVDVHGKAVHLKAAELAAMFNTLVAHYSALSDVRIPDPFSQNERLLDHKRGAFTTMMISLGRLLAFDQLEQRIVDHAFFGNKSVDVVDLQFEQSHMQDLFIHRPCTREVYGDLRKVYNSLIETGAISTSFDDHYRGFIASAALMNEDSRPLAFRSSIEKVGLKMLARWAEKNRDASYLEFQLSRRFGVHQMHRGVASRLVERFLGGTSLRMDLPSPPEHQRTTGFEAVA